MCDVRFALEKVGVLDKFYNQLSDNNYKGLVVALCDHFEHLLAENENLLEERDDLQEIVNEYESNEEE